MTREQKVALRNLEIAFRECGKVGLAFVGMESNILAYQRDELLAGSKAKDDFLEHQRKLGQGTTIKTYDAYIDSGGW